MLGKTINSNVYDVGIFPKWVIDSEYWLNLLVESYLDGETNLIKTIIETRTKRRIVLTSLKAKLGKV